ncbi:MAG: phosphomannomutase [Pseudomonadota bacterium]|nr:phosphomannomutase [Pseudomonadota bacterium]
MTEYQTLREALTYEPVPSRFGTSGVRALVSDLTDLEVYCLTLGTLRYLEQAGTLRCDNREDMPIPVAGDLRPSSERLLGATLRAIRDKGFKAVYCGRIPTPALTYFGLEGRTASFVVTGSHIPANRNGQKANRCDGEVLKSDEAGIVAAVEAARGEQYARDFASSAFDAAGMLKPGFRIEVPVVDDGARSAYLSRYRAVFPEHALKGMRIVFFQYSAVGRDLFPVILERAGAEVIRAGRSDEFVPIDTEAISDSHLAMLEFLVLEARSTHGHVDAIVSTDGDSDRPLVVGVEDTPDGGVSLRFFPGDLLGILVADYLRADAASVPISANPAVAAFFSEKGIEVRKTRIGSPFVIESMQASIAEGKGRVVSWEANGGFLVGTDLTMGDAVLKALPTRDAALPILCVLHTAAKRGGTLHQVFDALPGWYGKADLLDDFPREISQAIIARYHPETENVQWVDFGKDRVTLRDIDEKVVGERKSDSPGSVLYQKWKCELEALFTTALGFGELTRLNVQDGIRCYFANGDIAHIRPSGNAPQLRIYAHARSQERAEEIARMGVAEPDGILRSAQAFMENL